MNRSNKPLEIADFLGGRDQDMKYGLRCANYAVQYDPGKLIYLWPNCRVGKIDGIYCLIKLLAVSYDMKVVLSKINRHVLAKKNSIMEILRTLAH